MHKGHVSYMYVTWLIHMWHLKKKIWTDKRLEKEEPPPRYTHTHTNTHTQTHTHIRTHARTHTHTHARAHTHTHVRAHTHARAHTHTHARAHTHTHAHTHTCTRACTYACTHIYEYVCMTWPIRGLFVALNFPHTHTYKHTSTHTSTHTNTYTHTHLWTRPSWSGELPAQSSGRIPCVHKSRTPSPPLSIWISLTLSYTSQKLHFLARSFTCICVRVCIHACVVMSFVCVHARAL